MEAHTELQTTWTRHLQDLLLYIIVACLSLAVLGCVGIGAYVFFMGWPVYFVPPGGPGIARPGVVENGVALDFAADWLRTRYTFSPYTLEASYEEILPTIHPDFLPGFEAQKAKELREVKDKKISNQLAVLTKSVVLPRHGNRITVQLTVVRTITVDGIEVRKEHLTPTLTVMPWAPYRHALVVVAWSGLPTSLQ